jgi:hypothetical protein
MIPELVRTTRYVKFHTEPDLQHPEGTFGPGVLVEVIEREGPSSSVLVREQDGDRQGWVPARSVRHQ